jgi:hypothetical protein
MAEELTKNYVRATHPDFAILTMNFDHIYDNYIYPEYGIGLEEGYDLGFDEDGKKILGRFDPVSNTAYIDASLGNGGGDPRRAFTCWHEVGGHGVLQGEWLRRELARLNCPGYITTTEEVIGGTTLYELERQANRFAAYAAAPTWFLQGILQATFQTTRPVRYVKPTGYSLVVNGHTVHCYAADYNDLCRRVAYYISSRFGGLSLQALGYRVAEVGFVIDSTRPNFGLNRVA